MKRFLRAGSWLLLACATGVPADAPASAREVDWMKLNDEATAVRVRNSGTLHFDNALDCLAGALGAAGPAIGAPAGTEASAEPPSAVPAPPRAFPADDRELLALDDEMLRFFSARIADSQFFASASPPSNNTVGP